MTTNLTLTTTALTDELESRINAITAQTTPTELLQLRRAVESELIAIDSTAVTNLTNAIQTRINSAGTGTSLQDLLIFGVLAGKADFDIVDDVTTLLTRADVATSTRATPQNVLDSQGVITTAIGNIPSSEGFRGLENLVPSTTRTMRIDEDKYDAFNASPGSASFVNILSLSNGGAIMRLIIRSQVTTRITIGGVLTHILNPANSGGNDDFHTVIDGFQSPLIISNIPPIVTNQSILIQAQSTAGFSTGINGLYYTL